MAIFYDFLCPVFAASAVQHVSDLHLKGPVARYIFIALFQR